MDWNWGLSERFSILRAVLMLYNFYASHRGKFRKIQYRVTNWLVSNESLRRETGKKLGASGGDGHQVSVGRHDDRSRFGEARVTLQPAVQMRGPDIEQDSSISVELVRHRGLPLRSR